MKKIISFFISLIILCLIIALAGFFYVKKQVSPVNKSSDSSESIRIEIHSGDTVKQIGTLLREKNVIRNEKFFYIFASRQNYLKYFISNSKKEPSKFILKSGIYYVNPAMNISDIYELLSSGRQEYISVSIPEGYTMRQIGILLEEKEICKKDDFINICKNPAFLVKNNIPLESAEGFLFPDTYFFIPNTDAEAIAQELINNFYQKASSIFDLNSKTPQEMADTVILASIVEREYKVKKEAPMIASVFKNRLRIGMGLQSCATVMYILEDIQGKPHQNGLSEADTKIDSPYNTYKWAGLTPGPISNPGITALDAVINAPKTSYYFFFVNYEKNDGTHIFSKTFDEHVQNRRKVE